MRVYQAHLRQLALVSLIVLTLSLYLTAQGLKTNYLNQGITPEKDEVTPTQQLSPAKPSPQLQPAAKATTRMTDPRLKDWLDKIPASLERTEYLAIVAVPEQKNYIFNGKTLLKTYTISTGTGQNKMPEAVWRIGEKKDTELGVTYGPRLMFLEVWDRKEFKETTRALHGTNEPEKIGTNFGLGCVYHYNEDITELYDLLPQETLVVTTYDHNPADWEILIGGTVVLSRGVDERIRKYHNINYPWENIAPLMQAADLSIINLKSPFIKDCPYVSDQMIFCAQTNYIHGLTIAGVDLVSIAGNHLGDYGLDGITYTIQVLANNNILFTGAGENKSEALKPQIITLKDSSGGQLKAGFFSFNTVAGTSPAAGENSAGVAWWGENEIQAIVKELKPHIDILICMPNWGPEYTHQPTQEQVEIGRKLVDWGVDVVAGDQAHWVQKYEEYNNGLIFYGLGNLIFDQMWSEKTRQGLLIKLKIDKNKKIFYELIPTILENYAQPRLASVQESKQVLSYIK